MSGTCSFRHSLFFVLKKSLAGRGFRAVFLPSAACQARLYPSQHVSVSAIDAHAGIAHDMLKVVVDCP